MSSTAGNKTAKDSMDEIKADPEQRSQGTSPPSLLGSYFEAGDEDKGEPLGSTHPNDDPDVTSGLSSSELFSLVLVACFEVGAEERRR